MRVRAKRHRQFKRVAAQDTRQMFTGLSDDELMQQYRGFNESVATGGIRCGSKVEANMLRDFEAEIQRRQEAK